jgi:DNA-binding transcriptional LysR family regulator
LPDGEEDLGNHWFIGHDSADSRAPFNRWLAARVGRERVIYRTIDNRAMLDAIRSGLGIGFVSAWSNLDEGEFVDVLPPNPEWAAPLWLVTHVDLHRTTKVQAFLKHLKEQAKTWPAA